ncbi:MAG: HAMP domain-containing histidine kinase, partial [Coriobacteriales bacterium]|nr:HAMP domain-containing histidine kinase [Coriobacteriales bacterium]
NNHDQIIFREQEAARIHHNRLIFDIQNSIFYTKLTERTLTLTDDRTQRLLKDTLGQQSNSDLYNATLFLDSNIIYKTKTPTLEAEQNLLQSPDYSSTIVSAEDGDYLLIVSSLQINDLTYKLVSSTDITSTYKLFQADFDQVRLVSIISALIVAGILLLVVRGLLRPLRSLSSTTRRIASGELDKRAAVRGDDELTEVARNLNSMATSIQNNVNELEQLAESRKIFIGNLAHEMKTPLTSILGYADILRIQKSVSDDQRREYANIIVSETKRLQSLSGKLMELLSVGSLAPNLSDVELNGLISELAITLQPVFLLHKMNLICDMPNGEITVRADVELLKSLLYNLIDNAIKASTSGSDIVVAALPTAFAEPAAANSDMKEGKGAKSDKAATESVESGKKEGIPSKVTVELEQVENNKSGKGSEGKLRISVSDSGIGIPPEKIAQISEPFFTLDKARTRKHGGAGLGLALCAEIARAHGSELQITSESGAGTTVYVDFQLVSLEGDAK